MPGNRPFILWFVFVDADRPPSCKKYSEKTRGRQEARRQFCISWLNQKPSGVKPPAGADGGCAGVGFAAVMAFSLRQNTSNLTVNSLSS
jgi:hypothetical protein